MARNTNFTIKAANKPGYHRDHGDGAAVGLYLLVQAIRKGGTASPRAGYTDLPARSPASPVDGVPALPMSSHWPKLDRWLRVLAGW